MTFATAVKELGTQTPRIQVYPSTALNPLHGNREVVSRADEVDALAQIAGLTLDEWQYNVIEGITCLSGETYWNPLQNWDPKTRRATGAEEPKWAAKEYGLVVARQNGKGSIIEARALAGLFLWAEREIIYTSHHYRTMEDMFERMAHLTEALVAADPEAKAMLQGIKWGNGAQGIYMKDGRKMVFMARSKASVRGMSPDVLFLDEAMMKLGVEEIKAARMAVSARPNYQIINSGSAGTAEAIYFGSVRRSVMKVFDLGLKQHESNPRTGWSEWSAEFHTDYCTPDCTAHRSPNDRQVWLDTNPSAGLDRLQMETIEDEHEKIGGMDMDAFLLERCSDPKHWPSEGGGWRVIPKQAWEKQSRPDLHMGDKFCLAVDTAPEDAWTCITACGATKENPELAMVETTVEASTNEIDYRPGSSWALERIIKIWKASRFEFVAIDPATPAGALIPKLEAQHIPVKTITARDYNQACGDFLRGVAPKQTETAKIVHSEQAPMTTAAGNADKVERVELWSWDKRADNPADITPITSATKAYGAYLAYLYAPAVTPFFMEWDL